MIITTEKALTGFLRDYPVNDLKDLITSFVPTLSSSEAEIATNAILNNLENRMTKEEFNHYCEAL